MRYFVNVCYLSTRFRKIINTNYHEYNKIMDYSSTMG